jgi:hypothetical protein
MRGMEVTFRKTIGGCRDLMPDRPAGKRERSGTVQVIEPILDAPNAPPAVISGVEKRALDEANKALKTQGDLGDCGTPWHELSTACGERCRAWSLAGWRPEVL